MDSWSHRGRVSDASSSFDNMVFQDIPASFGLLQRTDMFPLGQDAPRLSIAHAKGFPCIFRGKSTSSLPVGHRQGAFQMFRSRSIDDVDETPVRSPRVNQLECVQVAPIDAHEPYRPPKLLNYHAAVRPRAHGVAAGSRVKRMWLLFVALGVNQANCCAGLCRQLR